MDWVFQDLMTTKMLLLYMLFIYTTPLRVNSGAISFWSPTHTDECIAGKVRFIVSPKEASVCRVEKFGTELLCELQTALF